MRETVGVRTVQANGGLDTGQGGAGMGRRLLGSSPDGAGPGRRGPAGQPLQRETGGGGPAEGPQERTGFPEGVRSFLSSCAKSCGCICYEAGKRAV